MFSKEIIIELAKNGSADNTTWKINHKSFKDLIGYSVVYYM